MDKPDRMKRLKGAVRLWCLEKGYEEIPGGAELISRGEDKTVGFLLIEEITDLKLRLSMTKAKSVCDEIYVVITDPAERAKTLEIIPEAYGLLCISDPFGLGNMFQVFKKAAEG